MLTGSADRSIRMWRAGKSVKTFTGMYTWLLYDKNITGMAINTLNTNINTRLILKLSGPDKYMEIPDNESKLNVKCSLSI